MPSTLLSRDSRPISWVKVARKSFATFPAEAQDRILTALTIAAEGRKADIAKPLKEFGSGVLEIVLKHRSDAFRTVYVVQLGENLWVIHAFQKKSSTGIKTPKKEIDLICSRLNRLKKELLQ